MKQKSDDTLADVLEASPIGVAILEWATGKRLFSNTALTTVFGATNHEELLHRDISETWVNREDLKRAMSVFLNGEPLINFEAERKRLDGAHWWVLMNSQPVVFEGQEASLVWHIDITDRKRAEVALQDSDTLFRSIIDNARALISLTDLEGRYLLANKSFAHLRGISPEAIVGTSIHDNVIKEHASAGAAQIRKVIESGETITEERDTFLPDGAPYRTLITKFPVFNKDGRLTGVGSIGIDISESREMEKALRESEALLRLIIDHAPALINLQNMDGQYLMVNEAFARARGLTPEEMIGTTVHDRSTKHHANSASEHRQRVVENRETIAVERDTLLPDGEPYRALVTKFPVFDSNGVLTGIGSIGVDITTQKEVERQLVLAQEQAEIANRAKSEFLANMSHELRTPLNAVIGFSDALQTGIYGAVTPQQMERIGDIGHAGDHLLDLINDILDLSKIEAGEYEPDFEDVEIGTVIESSLLLIAGRAKDAKVQISTETPTDMPKLHADERILKQMMINLISNAVKFTPPGGTVVVSVSRPNDDGMRIDVRDTGIGMNEDDIPKALASFGQVEASFSRRRNGTGLGLPLVKAFMALHHGALEIESELGVGTVARLLFPAHKIR